MTPKISIIIPNYNEKANLLAGSLEQVLKYLKTASFSWEVIIADDGSTDGSLDLVTKFVRLHPGFRLLKNQHGGKAAAILSGLRASKGQIVLFTDMDQSTPLKEVQKLLPFYEQGFDVVFGSRGKARANFPLFRQLASFFFRVFRQALLLGQVQDTQCGFKSFKISVAKKLFPKLSIFKQTVSSGWTVSAFDVELLFLAQKAGYKLQEVDVDWSDQDKSTSKDRKFIYESFDMLKQILTVKFNDLFGLYK